MQVNVTLNCATIEEAVVALGKLLGGRPAKAASAAAPDDKPKQTIEERAGLTEVPAESGPLAGLTLSPKTAARRPRADKGKPRGPYVKGKPVPESPSESPLSSDADMATVSPDADIERAGIPSGLPEVSAAAGVPPPSAAAEAATLEDAQDALEAVFKGKGLPTAQEVLQQFGCARLRDLPAEKYAPFVAAARAVLK
jgi:hypothetical protein